MYKNKDNITLHLKSLNILFTDALLKILYQEGVGALWGGTLPSLVLVSNPTVQFVVYEALKRWFQRKLNKQVCYLCHNADSKQKILNKCNIP